MPRKSTSSLPAGDNTIAVPANSETAVGSTLEGDTSMLSIATDASTNTKAKANGKTTKEDTDSVGVDDLLLPRTLTSRLARGILPANTSIQKDALLALTKAATVFISYLAHNANELTPKKTVGPQDVLKAIQEIEMGGVMGLGQVGPDGKVGGRLERELEVFENVVRGKRKGYREKVKARESGASNLAETKTGDDGNEGGEREAKRARLEDEEDDGQTPNQRQGATGDKTAMPAQQSPPHSSTMPPPPRARATNGAMSHLPNDDTIPDDDLGDEHDDHAEDEEGDEARSEDDEDEDQAEEEDEDEDEERRPDEDDLDGYGPDDQLRHDMNGGDDDDDGLGDESD